MTDQIPDPPEPAPVPDEIVTSVAEAMRGASVEQSEELEAAREAYRSRQSRAHADARERRKQEQDRQQRGLAQREQEEAARQKAERNRASRERIKALGASFAPRDRRLDEIRASSLRADQWRNDVVRHARHQERMRLHNEIINDMENLFIGIGIMPPRLADCEVS